MPFAMIGNHILVTVQPVAEPPNFENQICTCRSPASQARLLQPAAELHR